jgi:radical SAM superfamily enzyme YgiQ (UPF0313 family)
MEPFKEMYNRYFDCLKQWVPPDRHGNFFNIGHDVLRNHMLAHIHRDRTTEDRYLELVRLIVNNTFFFDLAPSQAQSLDLVLEEFYRRWQRYILDLLEKEQPTVLGCSVVRDNIGPSLFAFRLAKQHAPDILTVMGGSVFSDHLRTDSPNFLYFLDHIPYVDHCVVGEGQLLLLDLLEGKFPAGKRVLTRDDNSGEVLGFSPVNTPDLSDFDVRGRYPYLAAQASASCPHQCSFCNVVSFFGDYREKDPAQTVREMGDLYQLYGNQLFFMNDSLLNRVADDLSERMMESDTPFYWDGYLRVGASVCDPDFTFRWRRGGFYRARLGVESGSQHVLDMMGKGITPDQTHAALASLAEAGIKTTTYWVIGHPGETEEDFRRTLDFMDEIKHYIFEAECNAFIFGFSGQNSTDEWRDKRRTLFPDWARELLIIQSWTVDLEPSRQETYSRMSRFTDHCRRLGIPNPYSLHDIYHADKRWQKLHKHAVPRLVDFNGDTVIDECRAVKRDALLQNKLQDDGDFGF